MTHLPEIDLHNAGAVIDLFHKAAESMSNAPCRRGSIDHLPAEGRLLLTGDLHDHLDHWQRIMSYADLAVAPTNHVLLQELIHGDRLVNGLDFSFRMLARVAAAVLAFPGQVHPVLGNHELAQYTRRAISKGAGNNIELFEGGVEWVFGDDTERVLAAIDVFFAAMPLGVLTANGLLCTHSLPDAARMNGFDVTVIERKLLEEDYVGLTGSAWMLTWGRSHDPELLESLALRWGVKTFCIGHQHVEQGIRCDGPRLVAMNSDHARGVVVPWELSDEPTAAGIESKAIFLQMIPNTQGGSA